MDAISLAHVTKRYDAVEAVADLSLTVAEGEMFGLIGPDGAGKTTTIRLACGLIAPQAGDVRVFGRDPLGEHRAITSQVGYLSQRFSLYADLSIDENVAFFAEIHGVRRYGERRNRLLEMMQLTPFRSRLAGRLSGGMKQKLALACTLVHEPRLILLDEPTTGVDPVSRREFWMLLSEFLAQGVTIVMATPYLDEAERCSRVALIDRGRLLALDAPDRLSAALPGAIVEIIATPQDQAAEMLAGEEGVSDVQRFGERIHVRLAADGGRAQGLAARLVAQGVAVSSARTIPASLEDVFISLVGRGA